MMFLNVGFTKAILDAASKASLCFVWAGAQNAFKMNKSLSVVYKCRSCGNSWFIFVKSELKLVCGSQKWLLPPGGNQSHHGELCLAEQNLCVSMLLATISYPDRLE